MISPDNKIRSTFTTTLPPSKLISSTALEVNSHVVINNLLNNINMTEIREKELIDDVCDAAETLYPGSSASLRPILNLTQTMYSGKTRSGNTNMPYFIHSLRVTKRYIEGFRFHQQDILTDEERYNRFINGCIIASNHDTVEEIAKITEEQVKALGYEALDGILKLTLIKNLPKSINYQKLKETLSIKVYDRIDNIEDFLCLRLDNEWGKPGAEKTVRERLTANIKETREFLLPLVEKNPFLSLLLQTVLKKAEKYLQANPPLDSVRRQAS